MVAQQHPRAGSALTPARHPLQRRVDTFEAAAFTVLVVLFAVLAPAAAVVAGHITDVASVRLQQAEHSWRLVSAELTQSAAEGQIGAGGQWGAAFVTATWPVPGGGSHTGSVAVPLNARAGDHVPVWINGRGQLTHAPLSAAAVRDRVASAALAAAAGVGVLLALAAVVIRVAAGRCRMAGWARAWAAADPRCSRQQ